jgi:hypothetical protein
MNAGVEKLGFNKVGGAILLASWIVILVVVLILVSAGCRLPPLSPSLFVPSACQLSISAHKSSVTD